MGKWMVVWYGASSLLFGLILFLPTRKFILAVSVNKHQRKVKRDLTEDELLRLRKKINLIAAVLSMTFAFLYNRFILFKFFGFGG